MMQRREFVAGSAAALVSGVAWQASEAEERPMRQLMELRHYSLASEAKRESLEKFLAEAAIPAWNRMGIQPVGVFRPIESEDLGLWVLLAHGTPLTIVTESTRLMEDEAYLEASKALPDSFDDPAYQRIESSLLLAFSAMPKVEVPTQAASRVLQLRIYESHNLPTHLKKVEMFEGGGELEIFHRVGLNPVFFGRALIGSKLPNLTYMLAFDNMDAQKAAWEAFVKDPQWTELKARPEYANTVSNITNILLSPSPGSQI
ncbi:NIPSNAP family protein [Thermopirellula anaerolimosa]